MGERTRFGAWRVVVLVVAATIAVGCGSAPQETAETAPEAIPFFSRSEGVPSVVVWEPLDGSLVTSPFSVRAETRNLRLEPAGNALDGGGHFHVITTGDCVTAGDLIPVDDEHLHAGTGANRLTVSLPPGTYELCAQLSDGFHVALNATYRFTVTVVDQGLD